MSYSEESKSLLVKQRYNNDYQCILKSLSSFRSNCCRVQIWQSFVPQQSFEMKLNCIPQQGRGRCSLGSFYSGTGDFSILAISKIREVWYSATPYNTFSAIKWHLRFMVYAFSEARIMQFTVCQQIGSCYCLLNRHYYNQQIEGGL